MFVSALPDLQHLPHLLDGDGGASFSNRVHAADGCVHGPTCRRSCPQSSASLARATHSLQVLLIRDVYMHHSIGLALHKPSATAASRSNQQFV